MDIFAKRIKKLREEQDLTQRELGDRTGLSPASIGFYERNSRNANSENIEKLCRYFNVSADYLLGLTNNRKPVNKLIQDLSNIPPEIYKLLNIIKEDDIYKDIILKSKKADKRILKKIIELLNLTSS